MYTATWYSIRYKGNHLFIERENTFCTEKGHFPTSALQKDVVSLKNKATRL